MRGNWWDVKRRQYLGLAAAGLTGFGANYYLSDRQRELDNPLGIPDEKLETSNFWTVSVLPDTQNYAVEDELIKHVEDQVEWISENKDTYNIVFATHEGDMVSNGASHEQWDRIESALSCLDGEVPYSVVPGNHDWETTNDKSSSIDEYLDRFGEKRFEDKNWYDDVGPNGLSHSQIFSAGGREFLHLGLEWEPRDEVLDWADNKIEDYRHPTLITTHSHLHKGILNGKRADQLEEENSQGNHGKKVFRELVYPKQEVLMVLSGHSFGGLLPRNRGEYHQISDNLGDQPVYEILADFQNRKGGGNGWMRNITFLPEENGYDKISVSTYSPSARKNQVGEQSDFYFELDFDERL